MAARFFSFPNPVNDVAARTVASGVIAMSVAALVFRLPWLTIPLAYGFVARVLAGPRISPLGRIATTLVAPRLPAWRHEVPGPPKRFAQGMGALFTLAALSLWLASEDTACYVLLALLLVPAGLEAILGSCVGCRIFARLHPHRPRAHIGVSRMRGSLRTAGRRPPGLPERRRRERGQDPERRLAAATRGCCCVALLDASHPGPVAGVTAAASGYAAAVGRGTHGIVVVGLAVLAGQLTIGWQNDATDAPRDLAVGRDDKPIATGAVRRSVVARAAVVTAVATVPLSLASGWRAGTVHLVAVASAATYNAEPQVRSALRSCRTWSRSDSCSAVRHARCKGLRRCRRGGW